METDPAGYSSTNDKDGTANNNTNQIEVAVSSGDNIVDRDFLDTQPASIQGQVRHDTDGDGNLLDPDTGISGVTVVLWSDPNGDGDPADVGGA